MPIPLSETQQDAVMRAVAPLNRTQREAFMQALAQRLEGRSYIGSGELYLTLRELQRANFSYPKEVRESEGHASKIARGYVK